MHRLLLSAFIAFAVLGAIFVSRTPDDDKQVELAFVRKCQEEFGPRVRLSGPKLEALCRCTAPGVLDVLGKDAIAHLKARNEWGPQMEAQLRQRIGHCMPDQRSR